MLLLAEAGRSLNKDLTSLFRHDVHTPKILERLVHELHTDKELCSYLFLNHPGSEDMLWGLINLLTEDSRIAGNASYVIGTLAETDLGKKRIAQICADRGDQARKILPALIAMLDMVETETAEDADCRMWMLRDDCLDEAIVKLTNLLMAKDMCTASNAALVLARLAIAEEGCARILNHRSSSRTLMQLCRSLGSDPTGCKRMLSLKTSAIMINSLIEMLHSGDSGCCKNACFALSCIASIAQGHRRVLEHNDINSAVEVLCSFLACKDEESVWFASMMLHTLACQKSGCLYLRTQPNVKLSLEMLLKRSNLKDDTKDEVEATVAILEKLPKPKPPNVKVESACSVVVTWEAIHPKSGLDVTYLLYQDKAVMYTGPKTTYIANDLTPATKYSFYLQACTDGDDSPLSDIVMILTLESVPSAPQRLRVLTKTTSQIKITWEAPAISNGVLRGYQVDVRGRTYNLDIQEDYFILSSLPPDTEFKFQVVYSGVAKTCTAKALKPSTEYTITVSAWCSEGRCESVPSKKRTAREVYSKRLI
ncbi:Tyrosine-protein phosphatase Lar-like [Acropora cervicornis]|uniref:Tyrosine-protein phosphatase Lar-like n=1 Tax=Acropora cervicornis TaxID=6130 RepID=A0AAD9UZB4_ACRCE|nr:Tyrosine-protein phosphatase Lar-like [Acropora cervicornis]